MTTAAKSSSSAAPAATGTFVSINACLVHERPEVVADLVTNLQTLDPQSAILLYDGSANGRLLDDRRVPRSPACTSIPRLGR